VGDNSRPTGGKAARRDTALVEVQVRAGEDVGVLEKLEELPSVGFVVEVAISGAFSVVGFQTPVQEVRVIGFRKV
jgi:hypothetical protein